MDLAAFAFAAVVYEQVKADVKSRWYLAVFPPALFLIVFFLFMYQPVHAFVSGSLRREWCVVCGFDYALSGVAVHVENHVHLRHTPDGDGYHSCVGYGVHGDGG